MALKQHEATALLPYLEAWLVALAGWGWCNWGEISRVFDGVF